jgi:hypothetical protein
VDADPPARGQGDREHRVRRRTDRRGDQRGDHRRRDHRDALSKRSGRVVLRKRKEKRKKGKKEKRKKGKKEKRKKGKKKKRKKEKKKKRKKEKKGMGRSENLTNREQFDSIIPKKSKKI